MKPHKPDLDAMSSRVLDEINFQASVLALHVAIESAGRGGQLCAPDTGAETVKLKVPRGM
jgi:hypothetical protein